MGYRNNWLNHAGAVSVHNEATIHAFERAIPLKPLAMLLVGVGNGGSVEVWRDTLPQEATVAAIDANPICSTIPGIDAKTCDVTNRNELLSVLGGSWFDVVIDSTETMQTNTWPFLRAGGLHIYENPDASKIAKLVVDLTQDNDSWLPVEEIMRIDTYQSCAVIEKRNPRVVPYLKILTGNFCDVVPENVYQKAGAKRVIPA